MQIGMPHGAELNQLPLPLAQLYRRARNAKTSLERHQAAFYLWEAALKLSSSVAIVNYSSAWDSDQATAERLKAITRPALGHWWEFLRLLLPKLADDGDHGFCRLRDVYLDRTPRDDLPRTAGLDAILCEALERRSGARSTVRVVEVWERLLQYRNRELGHGALGQRPNVFYDRMSEALLSAATELCGVADPLAERKLIYISDVGRVKSGDWVISTYELCGESPLRLDPLQFPNAQAELLPNPESVALLCPSPGGDRRVELTGDGTEFRSLHPLVTFDPDSNETLFFNARRGKGDVEYLSYVSGRTHRMEGLVDPKDELLAGILSLESDDVTVPLDGPEPIEPAGNAQQQSDTRHIGEFELLGKVGVGGMGDVYRAWQPSLGRQVALKCMRRVGDPNAEARFAREIRALGRVEHPNLVKVFTSGSEADRWFYAMEMVEGAPLSEVLRHLMDREDDGAIDANDWQSAVKEAWTETSQREQLLSRAEGLTSDDTDGSRSTPAPEAPPGRFVTYGSQQVETRRTYVDRVVEMVIQVAEAAHALHEAGILHRDIKPENIVITPDGGHAVLMDLGLAKLIDEESTTTKTRAFVGTLRYASPEQVLSAKHVDRRCDVYSFGVILWELLALRAIYDLQEDTSDPELMRRIQSTEAVSIRKHQRRVPRELDVITRKCLEKNPERRYASALELAEDLRAWREGEAISAKPPSQVYRLRKHVRRHRGVVTATAVLLISVLAVWYWAVYVRVDRRIAYHRQSAGRWFADEARKAPEPFFEPAERRDAALPVVAPGAYAEISRRVVWDLRAWYQVDPETGLNPSTGRPGALIRRSHHHLRKEQAADRLILSSQTTGTELYSRCNSHDDQFWVIAPDHRVDSGGDALLARHVVIDTSEHELFEDFSVYVQRTYQNALQSGEYWAGTMVTEPVDKVEVLVIMPDDRPFTSYSLRVARGPDLISYEGEQYVFTGDENEYIYWELVGPAPGHAFRIYWEW